MNRTKLAYVFSGLGIFVFGCEAARDSVDSASSASSSMTARDEYLASKAFAALTPDVASVARQTLDAAGDKGTHSLVGLYSSANFLQFAAVEDTNSCTTEGAAAALIIVNWAASAIAPLHGETVLTADTRFAAQVDALATRLSASTVDVTKIDDTLTAIGCAKMSTNDAGVAHCTKTLFTPPACEDTTGDDDDDTTTGPNPIVPATHTMRDAIEQSARLASLFTQAEDVNPSRGMQLEWNDLRARWSAGVSAAARESLKSARRNGSATIRRDAQAALRFDEATKLVDAMVRGQIAPNADAMNLVHAAVAAERRGELRALGENVSMGKKTGRRYLPGAAVKTATDATFAKLVEMRANRVATPLLAATFDQRMMSIHPYMDANGRTTRLMTDWMLMRGGYPPAVMNAASREVALLAGRAQFSRAARLEHITEGMRQTVAILEA